MKKSMKKIAVLSLAAVTAMGTLAGCGEKEKKQEGKKSESGLEEVTLTWYIPGNGPQAGTEKVEEAIYEYLKEDLNVRVDFVECDWGSYDDKMQMAIASQEAFDFCYTAHWSNSFYNNVSKNAFLELDDLLDEYGKDLKKAIPEMGWKASTVNGKIYGVPNMQTWTYQGAVGVATSWLDEYDFDLSKITSLEDMGPFFEKIKADHPEMYPIINAGVSEILNNSQNTLGFEELTGSKIPGVLCFDDTDMKIVNQYELPQVKEFFELMYDWNQKGYFRSDSATLSDDVTDFHSGKTVSKFTATYSPSSAAGAKAQLGLDMTYQPLGTPHVSTSSIVAALTSISRTSENPERAMMFLERMNTDKELYNLVCHGIEGEHYTKEGNYAIPKENSAYDPNQDWVYGNQFNGLYREGQEENAWELTQDFNSKAEESSILGFSFDPTPVQTELASISAVVDEYYLSLATGSVNPDEVLPEFIKKLEQAGSKTVIGECQTQLDDWVKSNK